MIAKLFLVAITAVVSVQAALSPAISDSNCKTTASCLGYPKKCALANCVAFIKWQLKTDHLVIEMRYKWSPTGTQRWIGFAASADYDMTNNPTEVCYMTSVSAAKVAAGYLTTKASPAFLPVATYISNATVSVTATSLDCRFVRMLKAPSGTDAKFSLDATKKYYILGGFGAMASANVLAKHVEDIHTFDADLLSSGGFTTISITSILLSLCLALANMM